MKYYALVSATKALNLGGGGAVVSEFFEINKGYLYFLVKLTLWMIQTAIWATLHMLASFKTQTFKQLQLERLLKSGIVIPASKLAETKKLEVQRVRDFEAAVTDEKRHKRTETTRPGVAPHSLITTRELFEY